MEKQKFKNIRLWDQNQTLPLSISVNFCCYYLSDQLIVVKQGQTKLPIHFCFWEVWPQQLT